MEYKWMDFSFDKGRLERSADILILGIDIDGHKLPENHYMAVGEKGTTHYCHTQPHVDCDCNDFLWGKNRLCKHLIAALVKENDELLVAVI